LPATLIGLPTKGPFILQLADSFVHSLFVHSVFVHSLFVHSVFVHFVRSADFLAVWSMKGP